MKNKDFFSTIEIAKLLGISRVAVFKKIKRGEIKAMRVGRTYIIPKKYLAGILGRSLSEGRKKEIEMAVRKTVKEYGETLKRLGKE